MASYKILTGFLATLFSFSSLAATDNAMSEKGNIDRGRIIASGTCAACHGANGIALIPSYPNLAGQHAKYTVKQLEEFKSGLRANAIMGPMASPLSAQDMADVGAFYETQAAAAGEPSDAALFTQGKRLFLAGDKLNNIPACSGCHSPNGKGIYPNYPRIAGQSGDYVRSQLNLFKGGIRANDTNKMMRTVAEKLSENDIEALAAYIATLN